MKNQKKFLIVDDDKSIQRTLVLIFKKKGYLTETAGSGSEAIDKARNESFNLAMLDLRLPDMIGVELIEPLKETNPDMVIILATGYASVETAVQAVNRGATAYITKPLDMDNVLSTIEQSLEKQQLVIENRDLYQQAQKELTERKRAEEEIQKLKEFNENIVQSMAEGIFIENSKGVVTFANPTMSTLLGYRPGELVGLHWTDLIPAKLHNVVIAANKRRLRGKSDRYEMEILRKDGVHLPVLISSTPQFTSVNNAYSGNLVVVTDISERVEVERELRESEARYLNLFKNVPVSLWEDDLSAVKVYIDRIKSEGVDNLALFFDKNPDELAHCSSLIQTLDVNAYTLQLYQAKDKLDIINNLDRIAGPDRFKVLKEELLALDSGRNNYTTETINYTLTGDLIHISLSMTIPPEAASTWSLSLVSVTDISERVKNEKEVQRRAELTETLNAIIAAAVTAPDLQTFLESALDRLLQVLNLSKGSIWIPPHFISRNFPPSLYEAIQQVSKALQTSGNAFLVVSDWKQVDKEYDFLIPIMEEFGIRASIMIPILSQDQQFSCLTVFSNEYREWTGEETNLIETTSQQLGVAIDRFNLLEKIKGQAHQLQETINTAPEGMLLLDVNKQVVIANPIARECLKVLANDGVGQALEYLGLQPVETFLDQRSMHWHTIELPGPPRRYFELVARPMEQDTVKTGHVLVIREVTHQKETDRYTQRQERLAAVGQLAAGIAHDFNNIMAVIILYSQLTLRMPEVSATVKERTAIIEAQSKRATDLIQQILDFSRRSVLELQPLDLLPLVKEVTKLLERMLPESIQIELATGRDQYTIKADPTRIQQALMNLAVNARDALPEGGLLEIKLGSIHVSSGQSSPLPEMEAGDWVLLQISDTGVGIPKEALPHIFEPFYTTKAPGNGTGLGLAQVYGIVLQHNGHIDVASRLNKGTTFTIYFPALEIERDEQADSETLTQAQYGSGQTILVVEDNPATRQAVVESLEQLDYRVIQAKDGRQALEIFQEQKTEISLVLTDLIMPVMSGIDLAKQLKLVQPELKILFMSGYSDQTSIYRDGLPQNIALLPKPFTLDSLTQKIKEVLDE
ncbi:MAG: response regulator [Anaerolineales bacterium]|nr:response regulator [Anaerolineales bacterium]